MSSSQTQMNEAIIKLAANQPPGKLLSLCSGGFFVVDGLPSAEDNSDKTYYLSVFHDMQSIAIGEARTLSTVETFDTIRHARRAAFHLATIWGYSTIEAITIDS